MPFRKLLFWMHLVAGVAAGLVILVMATTGALMAFEPQLVEWAEHRLRVVTPPATGADRLSLDVLVKAARQTQPEGKMSGLTLRADPAASIVVNFGRDETLYIDPYTGDVLGHGSTMHGVMHVIEDVHRRLALRDAGRAVTGVCCVVLLFMVTSGLYIWWPRTWSRDSLRAIMQFNPRLSGKARDWNWHNVIGFWCALLLLVTTLTGLVMAYPWANDLLYRLVGSTPPPRQERAARGADQRDNGSEGRRPESRRGRGVPLLPAINLDTLVARAEAQVPDWNMMNVRFAQRPDAPVTVSIQASGAPHSGARSQLNLDPATGTVMKWEPFDGQSLGRKLRSWVRPIHTGQAFGVVGQAVMSLAALGAMVLVWTGLAMAWHRFWNFRKRCASRIEPSNGQAPVSAMARETVAVARQHQEPIAGNISRSTWR